MNTEKLTTAELLRIRLSLSMVDWLRTAAPITYDLALEHAIGEVTGEMAVKAADDVRREDAQ